MSREWKSWSVGTCLAFESHEFDGDCVFPCVVSEVHPDHLAAVGVGRNSDMHFWIDDDTKGAFHK